MGKTRRIESSERPGLSKIFKEFRIGEPVAIVKEPSVVSSFPLRIQGLTGSVVGKRGNSYIVEIKTQDKKKQFILEPVHLKRIRQ